MATDPVCFCEVSEDSGYVSEYEGRTYHFCTAGCKAKFDSDPAKWTKERVRAEAGQ